MGTYTLTHRRKHNVRKGEGLLPKGIVHMLQNEKSVLGVDSVVWFTKGNECSEGGLYTCCKMKNLCLVLTASYGSQRGRSVPKGHCTHVAQ